MEDLFRACGTLLVVFFFYFFPAIAAIARRHRDKLPIIVLNLFLGWTIIGWVAAMIWACTNNVEPETR